MDKIVRQNQLNEIALVKFRIVRDKAAGRVDWRTNLDWMNLSRDQGYVKGLEDALKLIQDYMQEDKNGESRKVESDFRK